MSIPNTDPTTAIDLAPLPASITLDLFDTIGTGAWYKYTPSATEFALSVKVPSGAADAYFPTVRIYNNIGLSTTDPRDADYLDPVQKPVNPAQTYYFRFKPGSGSPPLGTLATFTILASPYQNAPIGTIFIPDDTQGFPGVLLSAVDGSILKLLPFPAGENGDVLPSGIMAVENEVTHSGVITSIDLFTGQFAAITSILRATFGPGTGFLHISADQVDTFYLSPATTGGTGPLTAIDETGAVVDTWSLGAGVNKLAVGVGGGILYWCTGAGTGVAIQRYDLNASSPLSDLAAGIALFNVSDMQVLSDGTILVTYLKPTDRTADFIRHYSAAGATLNDYLLTTYGTTATIRFDHIARAIDDPNSFWLWIQSTDILLSIFLNIKVSDGSILAAFSVDNFEGGFGDSTTTADFGPSQSCPFFLLPQAYPASTCDAATILTQPASQYVELGASVTICTQFVVPGSPRQCQIDYVGPIIPIGGIFTGCGSSDPGTITLCLTVPVVTQTFTFNVTVTICPGEEDEVSTTSDDATVTVTSGGTGPGGGMRRLRRFKLPTQENKEIFFSKLEILLQRGVGLTTGQGSDPQMLIRLSKNGGKTWGTEIAVPAGKQGQFSRRAMLRRLGRARNAVVEISVSDPVYWGLLAAYVKLDEGTS